ncbi:uncharacterized protein SAPINGB_P004510 [Magnusiomyces paraingens]|uniref:Aminotransferase class I/classII large domain-containing protein n=1 Tax=Magnusiomyces paraingens TaxID=2606893 RepID=A0A5E8BUU0_9ASCO|nr:uncharacterized protein SAPINGB_P004510 [Saprochaete ingens]VVT55266.1 unnamed protein product [Saprochaete ingens]
MVNQEDFLVERWMDEFETTVQYQIAETCCASLSLDEVSAITGKPLPLAEIAQIPLTYGAIPGTAAAREAISAIYNDSVVGSVPKVTPEQVLVTNGAIGGNFLLYYSLVGPGDHVVVVDPIYQQLQSVPRMFGADVSLLHLEEDAGYLPDLAKLKSLLKSNTKLVIINSPHNPTGAVLSTLQLEQIVKIVKDTYKEFHPDGTEPPYIQCDEVYRPVFLTTDESTWPLSIVHVYERGVSTSSATKAYGLAGLRFGWVVSRDAALIEDCLKHRDYNTISVGLVDDALAAWALGNGGWRKLVQHHLTTIVLPNAAKLEEYVTSSNGAVSYVKPTGGTVVLLKIGGVKDTVSFCRDFIAAKSVLVVPGETFNKPGTIRIGFANKTADLDIGLELLKDYLVEKRFVPSPWNL